MRDATEARFFVQEQLVSDGESEAGRLKPDTTIRNEVQRDKPCRRPAGRCWIKCRR